MRHERWRLLGEQPSFDRNVPQAWKELVLSLEQIAGVVILNDPDLEAGENWLGLHVRGHDDPHRYLIAFVAAPRRMMRIYESADDGPFDCVTPMYEGHWRARLDEKSERPWPEAQQAWSSRQAFLAQLERVETIVPRIQYRGGSFCRLCAVANGHEAFRHGRWEWPAGYRHYIADHDVRPTAEFESFIAASVLALRST